MQTESKIYHLSEVTSTNELAKQLLYDDLLPTGSWVIADWQSAGRGQEKAVWESERGKNILCSTVVFPVELNIEDQVYLNLAVCLAVFDVVSKYCSNVGIKWPNDLYVNNQKIAGILIENTIQGNMLKSSIIGIGLNVNQTQFTYNHATSLSLSNQCIYDVTAVFEELKQCWQIRWEQLVTKQFQLLWNEYHLYLYKKDEPTSFKHGGKQFTGVVKGLHESGKLIVLKEGAEHLFQVKELEWQ